ncbi:hypothetical protein D9756_009037 [Leucocoprinus leucothites]|uniref:Nephrocystin 3-like N-terminal domain-containing protein n=1 Tax=Leucocoprinus leucothites TaxID=201217 RepID=A0A8H5FV62_9AGAR|nr:hypothetical protein D9756_009037 [Leucoagaricus leucothites]
MSRRIRNFFVKLTHFFKRFFDPSRPAAGPNSAASQACTSAPQRPPMPLTTQDTPSLSQPATTTPPTPQPVPPTPPLVSPTSATPTPALLDVEPSTLAPTPSPSPSQAPGPLSLASSPAVLLPTSPSATLPQHFRVHGTFPNAHDFILNYPQFNESSHAGSGLKELLEHSMPDAFHDSGVRYPPPKCHLGTRNEYIDLFTNWALGTSDRREPILWMHGPFGVGKSAVAQSCAEALESMNKLAATLFFSRSNTGRDDPQRVFTSIAYQIATACPSLGEIVSRRMIEHPALPTKSLSKQFKDLLVQPLSQVDTVESGLAERVVIIDGLDECRGTEKQCEIIKIIAASARERTTPFRWFITSRPEDAIIRTMNSPAVSLALSRIELPVSREIDHEILLYLTDEFKVIREDHGLPESWPSEEALALLVERGAGLWIYVSTIVRFIKDENSLGPKDQLCIVLEFVKEVSAKVGLNNPLAEMDFLYTLIIRRVPLKTRITVQKILLACSTLVDLPSSIATALCLSVEQLRHACASIQSVMELTGPDLESMHINFYHTSFLDFMEDPQRSKDLCICGDFLIDYRQELLEWLHKVCARSTDSEHIVFPSSTVLPEGITDADHYLRILDWFWRLCQEPEHPFDFQTTMSFAGLPFRKMLSLLGNNGVGLINGDEVTDSLPAELCDKIIRKGKCLIPGCTNTEDVWILGNGENEIVPLQWDLGFQLRNNVFPDSGCVCGVQMQIDHNEGLKTDVEDTDDDN